MLNRPKAECGKWSPKLAVPGYKDQWLHRMVRFASRARTNNKSVEILKDVIQEKGLSDAAFKISDKCDGPGGQIRPRYYTEVFGALDKRFEGTHSERTNEEDVRTGFMIFSAMIFCPKSAKETFQIYHFLHNLLAQESPRTIIQGVVNTIQSDAQREVEDKKRINDFFLAMDKHFRFQYGKILLAILPRFQLNKMINKDWPFFEHFRTELDECLNGTNCNSLEDLIATLGG